MVNACEIKNGQLFNCHGTRNLKIANQYADAFTIVRELDTFSACDQIFTISQLRVRRSQQNLICANWRVHWYLRVYVYVCIYLFFIFAIAVSASARLTNIRNAPINELVIALGLICLARCDFGFGFDFDFTIAACFIVFANRIATAAAARIGRECGCGYACARVFIVGLMSCSALGSSRWRVDWSSDTVGIRATIYDHLWATSTAASLGYWAANACSSQQWLDAMLHATCSFPLSRLYGCVPAACISFWCSIPDFFRTTIAIYSIGKTVLPRCKLCTHRVYALWCACMYICMYCYVQQIYVCKRWKEKKKLK